MLPANVSRFLHKPLITDRNLLSLNCSSGQMAPCSEGASLLVPA
jgi:hypothetical protein